MRQYLAEGAQGGFTFLVDREKPFVTESRPGGKFTRIPGRFSVCDCVNGNNRRYRKPVWEKNLAQGSPLQESIARNAAFGLLEHPKDGTISLLSPISHHVTKASLAESKDATGKTVYEVHGEIEIYETEEGKKLKALIEGGYNPTVSSRGYGSLTRATDGVDEVEEDYVCESWDVVIKPSFSTAELVPDRTGKERAAGKEVSFAEAQKPNDIRVVQEQQQPPKAPLPSPGSVAPASEKLPVKESIMNLNEIKGRIAALRGANTAHPQRFAESMSEVENLHGAIDKYIAEDSSSRNYSGSRLHRELEGITARWSESVAAPAKQAKRLHENNLKLVKVVHATAKTGLTYKKQLGETLTRVKKSEKLVEQLTSRGKGWMQLAETRKAKNQVVGKNFDVACESLDLMTERYHQDTTELARRVIVLEFGEKAQTPAIQKSLKEATRLRHVAAVRAVLEGKKPGEIPAVPPVVEGKESPAAKPAAGAAPVNEGKTNHTIVSEARVTLTSSARDPRAVTESIDMVRRMSTATAK